MTIMRTLSTTLALLLLGGALRAQQYTPSSGRELPRSRVTVTSVPFDSDEPDRPNRYMGRIDEWTQDDNRFTARFTVPFAWINRQVFLHVGHATADYEVRVNGRRIAYNNNGSSPAEYNLTKAVQEGANTVQIILSEPSATARMESWREEPAPSFGDVWLMSQPTMYIRDVLVKNWRPNAGDDFLMAEVGIVVKTASLNPRTTRVHYELLAPDGRSMLAGHDDMTLDMRREDTLRFIARIPDTLQWSAARPLRLDPAAEDAARGALRRIHRTATRLPHGRHGRRPPAAERQARHAARPRSEPPHFGRRDRSPAHPGLQHAASAAGAGSRDFLRNVRLAGHLRHRHGTHRHPQ